MSKTSFLLHQLWAFSIVLIVLLLVNNESLPDYIAYREMFDLFNRSSPEQSGPGTFGFIAFLGLLRYISSDYEQVRILFASFGVILLIYFSSFFRQFTSSGHFFSSRSPLNLWLYIVLAFFFIVEFFLVRLRAGLSILLFIPFLINFNPSLRLRIPNRLSLPLLFSLVSIALSLLVHSSTCLVLLAFVYFPCVFRLPLIRSFKSTLYSVLILLLLWCSVLLYISGASEERGVHLYSDLNFFRLVAVFVLPFIFFIASSVFTSWGIIHPLSVSYKFPQSFDFNYTCFSFASVFLYSFGCFSTSGEAIVRVIGLASLPALVSIAMQGFSLKSFLPIYLLLVNSLFFINTIYFSSG